MEAVACPSCDRIFDDATLLVLHHEFEPCSPSHISSQKTNFQCPICNQTFSDPQILQIHVNEDHDHSPVHRTTTTTTTSDSLYAQELARQDRMKFEYEQQPTASAVSYEQSEESEDAQIARMLQEEENAQSFEEFQVD
jgi:uncharacterized C2H2 Zn-finger protein